jgi:uncharacterized protein YvpB
MRSLVASVCLVLFVSACGANPAHVAAVASPTQAVEEPSPGPAPSPPPRPTQRILDIKIHYQEHPVTCEAAALKMALSYVGISTDEMTLVRYMTVDMRPARFDAQGTLIAWGNPDESFVGNPDGHIEKYTGYGVYFGPVARAASKAGANVVASGSGLYGSAIGAQQVYDAVLDGHPSVVWISNTYRQVDLSQYIAFDGTKVSYTLTEHAVTVIGVRPDAVLINDPWFGRAWHPKAQFESAYRTFDGMAVIVGS